MGSLYFLLPALLAILVSFLVVRAASVALMMTGMEKKKAKFQALSAFSGTGFTTREAENVINHPQRRKIITWLIILGNAGIVTVIVTATSSMATSRGYQLPVNVFILIAGIFIIYKVATHKKIMRLWEKFIEDKLVKSTVFEEAATEDLLHFLEGYGLVMKIICEDSPLIGKTLAQVKLTQRGLIVLGIERGKSWIPVPERNEKIQEDDRLVLYGPLEILKEAFHGGVYKDPSCSSKDKNKR